MSRDTGIADRLRAAGLKVVEVDGWRERGADLFHPVGSVDHHTGNPNLSTSAPSLRVCINGRSDLPGPLCNVMVGRDNTCYVVAAGRANHAGKGSWHGYEGNANMYGVERENTGSPATEPWREDQTVVAAKVHAALLKGVGSPSADLVCLHREWAPGRKTDAHTIDGNDLRRRVYAELQGIPHQDPNPEDSEVTREIWIPADDAGAPLPNKPAIFYQEGSWAHLYSMDEYHALEAGGWKVQYVKPFDLAARKHDATFKPRDANDKPS